MTGYPPRIFRFYHLISGNRDIMLKVALCLKTTCACRPSPKLFSLTPTVVRAWTRCLVLISKATAPDAHHDAASTESLRKDYPARATGVDPFELTKAKRDLEMEALTR